MRPLMLRTWLPLSSLRARLSERLGREEGAARLLLALLVIAGLIALLLPARPVAFPERVVHAPGLGWVDADTVSGLSDEVEDGASLVWAVAGEGRGPAPVAPAEAAAPHALAVGARVSLNHASLAELESLPGVGPSLAARIVAARPFHDVEALDRVRGVGPKSYARLVPLVQP